MVSKMLPIDPNIGIHINPIKLNLDNFTCIFNIYLKRFTVPACSTCCKSTAHLAYCIRVKWRISCLANLLCSSHAADQFFSIWNHQNLLFLRQELLLYKKPSHRQKALCFYPGKILPMNQEEKRLKLETASLFNRLRTIKVSVFILDKLTRLIFNYNKILW